jgi:hypothetical protein
MELYTKKTENKETTNPTTEIKKAQDFFRTFGVNIEADTGLIETNISEETLTKIHEWSQNTNGGGSFMDTEDMFYKKIYLASSLWRQKDGNSFNYLQGKGTGVEVALRGTIEGRKKRPYNFSYRSHSDFDLYGVNLDSYNDLTKYYSPQFHKVFGSEEVYPNEFTKGLTNLPPSLLHDTAEKVNLGGIEVYIPKLELLFLDKFIMRESTPRPEGFDAVLLAYQYELDLEELHRYLDDYVISNITKDYKKEEAELLNNYRNLIPIFLKRMTKRITETISYSEDSHELKKFIEKFIAEINDLAKVGGFMAGFKIAIFTTITSEDFDQKANFTEDYINKFEERIKSFYESEITRVKNLHNKLDIIFSKIKEDTEN